MCSCLSAALGTTRSRWTEFWLIPAKRAMPVSVKTGCTINPNTELCSCRAVLNYKSYLFDVLRILKSLSGRTCMFLHAPVDDVRHDLQKKWKQPFNVNSSQWDWFTTSQHRGPVFTEHKYDEGSLHCTNTENGAHGEWGDDVSSRVGRSWRTVMYIFKAACLLSVVVRQQYHVGSLAVVLTWISSCVSLQRKLFLLPLTYISVPGLRTPSSPHHRSVTWLSSTLYA